MKVQSLEVKTNHTKLKNKNLFIIKATKNLLAADITLFQLFLSKRVVLDLILFFWLMKS